jgi:hypothetical protein
MLGVCRSVDVKRQVVHRIVDKAVVCDHAFPRLSRIDARKERTPASRQAQEGDGNEE